MKKLILSLAIIFLALDTFCQQGVDSLNCRKWYGKINLAGGSNFNSSDGLMNDLTLKSSFSNNDMYLDSKVGYKDKKIDIRSHFRIRNNTKRTSFIGTSYKIGEDNFNLNINTSYTTKRVTEYLIGLESLLQLSSNNRINFSIIYTNTDEKPENTIYSLLMNDNFTLQENTEKGRYYNWATLSKLTWSHKFSKKGRNLYATLEWLYKNDNRNTIWFIGNGLIRYDSLSQDLKIKDSTGRYYRLTPNYVDDNKKLVVSFNEPNFAGVERLNVDLSLESMLNSDRDSYSGANLIEGKWVDSTRLIESFDYLSITITPRIQAEYSTEHLFFKGSLTPEFFSDRLNSQNMREKFDAGKIELLFNVSTEWKPSPRHSVKIQYYNGVIRPDYLQLCWFQRPGVLSNEIRAGNPDLIPSNRSNLLAKYNFILNKFSASFEAGYSKENNRIEQTFNMGIIEKKEFRIYTWLNAGVAHTANAKLNLKWSGKVILMEASGNFNHFIGFNSKEDESRSDDISLNGRIDVLLPRRYVISTTGRYQSKVRRVFSKSEEYYVLNARASKEFSRFSIFLEGNDLLDQERITEIMSQDGNEWRKEIHRENKRLFRIGLTFNW